MGARWLQRYESYCRAVDQLALAVGTRRERGLSELEQQGLIQAFEFTHELAWKTLKDFLVDRGNEEIFGSKDATREAFALGLISRGEEWMAMIQSRNLSSHTYDRAAADKIAAEVDDRYLELLLALRDRLEGFAARGEEA